jgi:hypothetical protein
MKIPLNECEIVRKQPLTTRMACEMPRPSTTALSSALKVYILSLSPKFLICKDMSAFDELFQFQLDTSQVHNQNNTTLRTMNI